MWMEPPAGPERQRAQGPVPSTPPFAPPLLPWCVMPRAEKRPHARPQGHRQPRIIPTKDLPHQWYFWGGGVRIVGTYQNPAMGATTLVPRENFTCAKLCFFLPLTLQLASV